MFFRKGEKLLLAILVCIMVCAMSGCGLIGNFYGENERNILENFLEREETRSDEDQFILDGEEIISPQGGGIIIPGSEGGMVSLDISDIGFEKTGFPYTVKNDGTSIYKLPENNPVAVGTADRGDTVLVLFQTEALGLLWGRTEEGWVMMDDVVYAECAEEETAVPIDENIVGKWIYASMDYESDVLVHNGTLILKDDGTFVYFEYNNMYRMEFGEYSAQLNYVGSFNYEAKGYMGTYETDGNTLFMYYEYIEEEQLEEPITRVCRYETDYGMLMFTDDSGNMVYAFGESDLNSIYERLHSGVE